MRMAEEHKQVINLGRVGRVGEGGGDGGGGGLTCGTQLRATPFPALDWDAIILLLRCNMKRRQSNVITRLASCHLMLSADTKTSIDILKASP